MMYINDNYFPSQGFNHNATPHYYYHHHQYGDGNKNFDNLMTPLPHVSNEYQFNAANTFTPEQHHMMHYASTGDHHQTPYMQQPYHYTFADAGTEWPQSWHTGDGTLPVSDFQSQVWPDGSAISPPSAVPLDDTAKRTSGSKLNTADQKSPILSLPLAYDKNTTLPLKGRHVGLQNLGNTCWLNSLLQAMRLTIAFTTNVMHFVLRDTGDKDEDPYLRTNINLLREIKILMAESLITKKKSLEPRKLRGALPEIYTEGNRQQDAHEGLQFLFTAFGGSDKSLIRLIFSGEVIHKIRCGTCLNETRRNETTYDFSFPVLSEATARKKKAKLSVQRYFNNFMKVEILSGDNKYKCEKCDKEVPQAHKWTEILSPPAHIVVVLQRYSWDLVTLEKKKEKTYVDVNTSIKVGEYTYKLYASIIHKGKTANSGHYYAIGKYSEVLPQAKSGGGDWFIYDDSVVRPVRGRSGAVNDVYDSSASVDDCPYVLFYRCTLAPPAPAQAKVPIEVYRSAKRRLQQHST
eukprot:Lankesteria_metandrocarpae@DN152_c0_g1_i1.p1